MLVEIAAREYRDVGTSAGVENRAHAARMLTQIAAVDAHALERDARAAQARGQGDDLVCGALGVVGIDQQHGIFRVRAREKIETGPFVSMCLDVRVGHRAEQRNAELADGFDGCRPSTPGEIAGARRAPRRGSAAAPCAGRRPKSTSRRSGAASTERAALLATTVW